MSDFKNSMDRYKIEQDEQWREWVKKIPDITFAPAGKLK